MAELKPEEAPPDVRAYCEKGVAAMERDNLDYAMDMFAAALEAEPRLLHIRKLLRAAALRKHQARPPGALRRLRSLAGLAKLALLRGRDPCRTLAAADRLLCADPANRRIAEAHADAAEACGLPEVAIQTLEILRDRRPDCPAVLERLAGLYAEAGLLDREYGCRERIAKLKPADADALKQLKDTAARLTMGKAGWQKADTFRDVLRDHPPAGTAEADDETVRRLRDLIGQEPANPAHRLALADVLLRRKQYAEAVQALEACQPLADGLDPQLGRKLDQAREQALAGEITRADEAGEHAEANELRKKLETLKTGRAARQVALYPNDLQLRFEYGKLLLDQGRHTEAIRELQLAQRNPQRRGAALLHLAVAFKAKMQMDIARDHLLAALDEHRAMDPCRKEILYELGALYEAMESAEQAGKCYKEIYAVDIGYRDVAAKVEGGQRTQAPTERAEPGAFPP